MRKLYSTLILSLVSVVSMAQGWPKDYNGVMLQGFFWDSFADTQWTRLEKQADDLSKVFDRRCSTWYGFHRAATAADNRWAMTICIGLLTIIVLSERKKSCAR